MEINEIKDKVNSAVDELASEFQNQPTLFYTEGDIVCRLYELIQKNLNYNKTKDRDGCSHYIVHREYPTPFRCSMCKSEFEIKSDNNRTPKGNLYRRGHYDIVVLNPNFIRESDYIIIKGQDYNRIEYNVAPKPAIIYGIEVIFNRKPLTSKGIDNFMAKIEQDYKKLRSSKTLKKNKIRFMEDVSMLVFNSSKGCQEKLKEKLKEKLGESTELRCIP